MMVEQVMIDGRSALPRSPTGVEKFGLASLIIRRGKLHRRGFRYHSCHRHSNSSGKLCGTRLVDLCTIAAGGTECEPPFGVDIDQIRARQGWPGPASSGPKPDRPPPTAASDAH